MLQKKEYKFWFCTGSQDLYGEECLNKVADHSRRIVEGLNQSGILPYEVVWKPTMITNEVIRRTFNEANLDVSCAGVITWMHTFSPAKSWILGLQELRKPLLHLFVFNSLTRSKRRFANVKLGSMTRISSPLHHALLATGALITRGARIRI